MAKYKPKNSKNSNQRKINQAVLALAEAVGTKIVYPPQIIKRAVVEKKLLTTTEAAALLGRKKHTLENWRSASVGNSPPFYKTGGSIVYKRSDLIKYLEERKFNNTSAYHSFPQRVEAK